MGVISGCVTVETLGVNETTRETAQGGPGQILIRVSEWTETEGPREDTEKEHTRISST